MTNIKKKEICRAEILFHSTLCSQLFSNYYWSLHGKLVSSSQQSPRTTNLIERFLDPIQTWSGCTDCQWMVKNMQLMTSKLQPLFYLSVTYLFLNSSHKSTLMYISASINVLLFFWKKIADFLLKHFVQSITQWPSPILKGVCVEVTYAPLIVSNKWQNGFIKYAQVCKRTVPDFTFARISQN